MLEAREFLRRRGARHDFQERLAVVWIHHAAHDQPGGNVVPTQLPVAIGALGKTVRRNVHKFAALLFPPAERLLARKPDPHERGEDLIPAPRAHDASGTEQAGVDFERGAHGGKIGTRPPERQQFVRQRETPAKFHGSYGEGTTDDTDGTDESISF